MGISPTPWNHETWQSSDDYGTLVKDADGKCICDTSFCDNMDANAALMSAAPDLLKVAYALVDNKAADCANCTQDCNGCTYINARLVKMAKEAIAKATNEVEGK